MFELKNNLKYFAKRLAITSLIAAQGICAQHEGPSVNIDNNAKADTVKSLIDTTNKTGVTPPPMDSVAMKKLDSTTAPKPEGIFVTNKVLKKLNLGGAFQLKGFYHNILADRDADKKLSLTLRRLAIDLDGMFDDHFGFKTTLRLETNGGNAGIDDAYLFYKYNDFAGFKGGKLRRPISQEALQSSKEFYTIERGELYHNFLANTTGYAYLDVGLIVYGGFMEEGHTLGYEFGIFNGKQSEKNYVDQHYEKTDKGFKAKDIVIRITASPVTNLNLEASLSTKAAEDTTNPNQFIFHSNRAYELGFNYLCNQLRLLGELAWGDNHQGKDSKILGGSTLFFTFYLTSVWHEDYSQGRASELILKWQGLDPDGELLGDKGSPNDGLMMYTLGVNYFFNKYVSVQCDYSLTQPVTKITANDDLNHQLEAMWRMRF